MNGFFALQENESQRVTLVAVHGHFLVANSCQLLPNEGARVKTSLGLPSRSQLTTTQTHSQPTHPSRSPLCPRIAHLSFRHATSTSLGITSIPRLRFGWKITRRPVQMVHREKSRLQQYFAQDFAPEAMRRFQRTRRPARRG